MWGKILKMPASLAGGTKLHEFKSNVFMLRNILMSINSKVKIKIHSNSYRSNNVKNNLGILQHGEILSK